MFTVEKKQSSPSLVAAATSPAGAPITTSRHRSQGLRWCMSLRPQGGNPKGAHHVRWLWGALSSPSIHEDLSSTLAGCGPWHHTRAAGHPRMGLQALDTD